MSAQPLPIGASGMGIDVTKKHFYLENHFIWQEKYDFNPWFNINKYVKEFHLCVIFLAKKFVLSMIIRIFAASVLAKPLNNAQIVRGVFCLYTFEYGESYSHYKTVWIFGKSR